jgi:DegV family protein with EDD domain
VSVCVVTDSSAVVPSAWLEGLPLRVVPLSIAWENGDLDPGDLPYASIEQRLRSESVPPKTGALAPGVYQELLAELLAENPGGVLVVCPAADLSTTYASATLGARELGDGRVRVLDAHSAAAGQGLVAIEAAHAAAAGASLDEVSERALAVASNTVIWATLSQLEFMKRSGRLPAIAAIGAGALGLQPIVRYDGSSPAPVGVTRNERRGTDRLYRAWERSIVGSKAGRAIAFHSERADDAATLVDRIHGRVPEAEAGTVEVTASLAAHTGPGLLGLAWFWDN